MNRDFNSDDRTPAQYTMFALAFIGFMLTVAGIILSSRALAGFGTIVLVLAVYSVRSRSLGEG